MEFETYADVIDSYNDGVGVEAGESLTDYIKRNNIKIKWHASIQEIPKIIWNNFLKGNSTPFYKWDWLNALERSKSVSTKYGWQPLFLSAWDANDLIACAPLYLSLIHI